jgi:Helix-turn-helix of DDE superfamily endonuclease
VCKIAHQIPPAAGRPWGLPLSVRLLLVLTHLPTNLTTRALAALFATSQSTLDPVIGRLVPVLAAVLGPTVDCSTHPWIIDATLIPVHDQSITAITKNYRRSVNTQILINANRRVIAVGPCWPANRNDVIVARTVAHLLDGTRPIPGDRGYRSIDTITSPRPATDSPDHPRRPLPQTPAYPRPRRTHRRPAQRPANPATMPTTRPSHQPQPPHHHRTLEPQEPGTITGQLLGSDC